MLRAFFIALSESRWLRSIAEQSSIGRRLSHRFVAGMTVEDALEAANATNRASMSFSIDNLGENVTDEREARESAALYHEMLDAIATRSLDGNASVKLTHMGLDVDPALAVNLVDELVAHAVRVRNFLRIDMEGSPYTQRTLDLVREIHRRPGHQGRIGAVLQSYLRRTEQDARELCAEGIRIRLCKGAYKELASIAFQAKSEVDANFVSVMKILLQSGVYHGIATHDPAMIDATKAFARENGIPVDAFEFQMLYGIRRDIQEQLVREGWRLRIYIPFGREWYPYFMRRLAERPANVVFILKNLFRR
ncbi:MAG TPA: proline dehydrogenase family protein [Thermoanaerobaculia bacterium]|nr:proline dehydrogenase family protein [Thermoanaerobaculia bacterium]